MQQILIQTASEMLVLLTAKQIIRMMIHQQLSLSSTLTPKGKQINDNLCSKNLNFPFNMFFRLEVTCSEKFNSIKNVITVDDPRNKRSSVSEKLRDSSLFGSRQKRNQISEIPPKPLPTETVTCKDVQISLTLHPPSTYSTNVISLLLNPSQ